MATAAELKHIFQDGWNRPDRVENYVRNVAHGEFEDAASLRAWRECLDRAWRPAARSRSSTWEPARASSPACIRRWDTPARGWTSPSGCCRRPAAARRPWRWTAQFVFGDAEEPPFQPETFDVVSSRHLLFNLPHPGLAVRRWVRLLKPGGRMILIGDAPEEAPAPTLHRRVRSNLDRSLARLRGNNRPGWRPTADYMKAVSQCPLFRHRAGAIPPSWKRPDSTTSAYPTDAIHAARAERTSAGPGRRSRPDSRICW